MPALRTASAVLDESFLEVRAKLIELAASLDRIERSRAFDAIETDARLGQVRESLSILAGRGTDRAERIQLVFSDVYEPGWSRK